MKAVTHQERGDGNQQPRGQHGEADIRPCQSAAAAPGGTLCPWAIVGRAWFDPTHDLEAVENGDMVAFGQQIADELYEEGYPLAVVAALGAAILERIKAGLVGGEEVDALVGFSAPPRSGSPDGTD